MKKSLWLISLWCLIFAGKCGDAGKNSGDSVPGATAGPQQTSDSAVPVGIGNSSSRDSVKTDSPGAVHEHGGPDQDKVDSIKNEKLKGKIPK